MMEFYKTTKSHIKQNSPFSRQVFFVCAALVIIAPLIFLFANAISPNIYYHQLSIYIFSALLLIVLFCAPLILYEKPLIQNPNLKNKNVLTLLPFIFLIAFLVWATISTFFALDIRLALFDYGTRNEGLFAYYAYAVIFFCFSLIKDKQQKRILIYLFVGEMCFISLYWIIDFFTFHYGFLSLEWEFVTPWCNPNHSGYMLAISIMLSAGMFLFDNHKIAQSLGLAGFCLLIITLGFNNTFGCQLSTLVAMICLSIACLLREKKNYLKLLILWAGYIGSMAIISAILEHNQFGISSYWQNFKGLFKDVFLITSNNANANTAGTNRWGLWKECFRNIREHPIFGIGINCQRIDNPLIESGRPHNELLQFTSTMGLPAGIFYLLAIIFTGIISIKQIKKIDAYSLICLFGAMGYFLSSFFGVSLTYTFPYFLIFLALGLNGIDHKKPSQNNCLSNKNIIQ